MTDPIEYDMIWQGWVSEQMVIGWSDDQVNYLRSCLDEAIQDMFAEVEKEIASNDPLVRLAFEEEYGQSMFEGE